MNMEERLLIARDSMDVLSDRLKELSNLINTVYSGLRAENVEQQVLDCVMCFLYSVNELHELAEQTRLEIRTTESNTN